MKFRTHTIWITLAYAIIACHVGAHAGRNIARISLERLSAARHEISQHIEGKLANYRLARTVFVEECYDIYIPKIEQEAERGRESSEQCVTTAETARTSAGDGFADRRTLVQESISALENNLEKCSDEDEVAIFLQCLIDTSTENKSLISKIGADSKKALSDLNKALREVDKEEEKCIATSVKNAKENTDTIFNDLQKCIANGPPAQS